MKNNVINSLYLFLMIVHIGFSQQKKDTIEYKSINKSKPISIPVETMIGHRNMNYLSIVNASLGKSKTLGYFSVITIATPYDKSNAPNEFVISNSLTYKLTKGLFATGGLQYHFLKGVAPTLGFQFLSVTPKWLIVVSPSTAFAANTSLQNVGIVEFKPRLSRSLKLYSRLQGIYNMNLKSRLHERSLIYLRTGVTLHKTSIGLGVNFDFYGANKTRKENLGIFIHHLL